MSAGILLIDGYNLMHAAGMAQHDYKPGELLKCRTQLLRYLLGKLSAAEIRGTTIVFDARDPPPDRPAQVVVSGLKVLFANPGGDADVVIQEWLARHPSPRRVTLVSSDRVLQRAARGCRSKFIGSDEFLHEMERRRGRAAVLIRRRADSLIHEEAAQRPTIPSRRGICRLRKQPIGSRFSAMCRLMCPWTSPKTMQKLPVSCRQKARSRNLPASGGRRPARQKVALARYQTRRKEIAGRCSILAASIRRTAGRLDRRLVRGIETGRPRKLA